MAKVIYIRVGTAYGQTLEVQEKLVKEYGVDKVFAEKVSGTTQDRPQLKECLQYLREGDCLIITRLDRLARSTLHLHQIVNDLTQKGVGFKCLQQNIDTTTKEGRLMFSVLSAIANFETELRAERCAEGVKNYLAKGGKLGAPKKLSDEGVERMRLMKKEGSGVEELMKEFNVCKPTVYRLLSAA